MKIAVVESHLKSVSVRWREPHDITITQLISTECTIGIDGAGGWCYGSVNHRRTVNLGASDMNLVMPVRDKKEVWQMKIKWLGHASFLIVSSDGTRVITDPYTPGGSLTYAPISERADIVTVSHGHGDHSNTAAVRGNPVVVKDVGSRSVKGVEIKGVATFHDVAKGAQRGQNTVFCITMDGLRVLHLGDLGHALKEEHLQEIGPVDVLLTPVGGNYTIDGPTASQVADATKASVVIPMHFRTTRCAFPITDAEPFLRERESVRRVSGSEVELTKDSLPKTTETVVLQPAM